MFSRGAAVVDWRQLNVASITRPALLITQGPVLPEQWKLSLHQGETYPHHPGHTLTCLYAINHLAEGPREHHDHKQHTLKLEKLKRVPKLKRFHWWWCIISKIITEANSEVQFNFKVERHPDTVGVQRESQAMNKHVFWDLLELHKWIWTFLSPVFHLCDLEQGG